MSVLKGKVVTKATPVADASVCLITGERTVATTTTDGRGEYCFEASDGVHHELADTIFGNGTQARVRITVSHGNYSAEVAVAWDRGQEMTLHPLILKKKW